MLLTPYPPGIPLLIPGERFNRKIVDYLQFARDFNAALPRLRHRRPRPGRERTAGRRPSGSYFVDCVKSAEGCARPRDGLRPRHRPSAREARRRARSGQPSATPRRHRVAEAAVDVDDLGGDAGGQVGQQEGGGVADVVDRHVAAQRRVAPRTTSSILPKPLMPEAASVLIGPAEMPLTRTPFGAQALRPGSARWPRATPWPGPWCCSWARCAPRPGRSASAAPRRRAAAAARPWPCAGKL